MEGNEGLVEVEREPVRRMIVGGVPALSYDGQPTTLQHGDIVCIDEIAGTLMFMRVGSKMLIEGGGGADEPSDDRLLLNTGFATDGVCLLISVLTGFRLEPLNDNAGKRLKRYRLANPAIKDSL